MATRTERNAARRTIYPSPNAVAIVSDNTIRFVNEAFVRLVHASTPQDLIGKSALGLIHGDSNTVAHQLFEEGDKRTTVQAAVLRLLKLDGTTVDVDVRCESIDHGGERGFLLALTDLDWSSAHDLAIERLNRLYAALAHVNQAIVRMPTRQDLFQSVCDALVEQGAVRMAWIAWKSEDELEELLPVAACASSWACASSSKRC